MSRQIFLYLLIEGFFTHLSDMFALRQLEGLDANGNAVLERYNGSGARVMELNLEAKAFFSSHFDIQGGVTLQRSRYKKPEEWSDNPDVPAAKKMLRTPDIYGYFTANWKIIHSLRATFNGTATGTMLVQHMEGSGTDVDLAVTTQSFFDASVKLTYTFKLNGNATSKPKSAVSALCKNLQTFWNIKRLQVASTLASILTERNTIARPSAIRRKRQNRFPYTTTSKHPKPSQPISGTDTLCSMVSCKF